ncbi:MAG: Na/Pi cotransporter family protein [Calditrichia bacterium]|nr:Na/Pi cotransporter family protein [Calditrichia bacterium]
MGIQDVIKMLVTVIGGLGLFLIGMKQMSEGMQAIAGNKLRTLISKVTDNRFVACGVGATITASIQSSSVTTVMVVGMVNAGLMTLKQSIGVIMGANIGTTITAWLIALKIADYGLPILGISAFFYLFSKNEKLRYTAMMFVGLGMVFFGLELMKGGFYPLRSNQEFISIMSQFSPDTYLGILKCIFTGALFTAIIQSSSATVAITITLAQTGIIGYETAVALVLGENIGTTVTAYLASLGASANAKRTTYAHIFLNVSGAILLIPIFYQYVWLLKSILSPEMAISSKIAFAHSGFNFFIVSVFIWFVKPLSRFVTFLVPAKEHKEMKHLTYLDVRMYDTPSMGIQQSSDEIKQMGRGIRKMFDWLYEVIFSTNGNEDIERKIFHREEVFDLIQKEVVEFIGNIMTGRISHEVMGEGHSQLRMADEYESISDYITNILKLNLKVRGINERISDEGLDEILDLHEHVGSYINFINDSVNLESRDILSKAESLGHSITAMMKKYRSNHLVRVEKGYASPQKSLFFTDILNSYRRIKDHALNIAEVLAGEK